MIRQTILITSLHNALLLHLTSPYPEYNIAVKVVSIYFLSKEIFKQILPLGVLTHLSCCYHQTRCYIIFAFSLLLSVGSRQHIIRYYFPTKVDSIYGIGHCSLINQNHCCNCQVDWQRNVREIFNYHSHEEICWEK